MTVVTYIVLLCEIKTFIIIILRADPAPTYEALFLSTDKTPFLRLNQRAMGDESKNSLNA